VVLEKRSRQLSPQSELCFGCFWEVSNFYKVFFALGNDRPQVLVKLEDSVLEAIIAISEGKSSENVLDALYSQVLLLEKDLKSDNDAMNWFNLVTPSFSALPTPPASVFPSTPSGYRNLNQDKFQGQ
jgi:hypothetical protein